MAGKSIGPGPTDLPAGRDAVVFFNSRSASRLSASPAHTIGRDANKRILYHTYALLYHSRHTSLSFTHTHTHMFHTVAVRISPFVGTLLLLLLYYSHSPTSPVRFAPRRVYCSRGAFPVLRFAQSVRTFSNCCTVRLTRHQGFYCRRRAVVVRDATAARPRRPSSPTSGPRSAGRVTINCWSQKGTLKNEGTQPNKYCTFHLLVGSSKIYHKVEHVLTTNKYTITDRLQLSRIEVALLVVLQT